MFFRTKLQKISHLATCKIKIENFEHSIKKPTFAENLKIKM